MKSKNIFVSVSRHAAGKCGPGDTTVPRRVFFKRGWATQPLHPSGTSPRERPGKVCWKPCYCQYILSGRYGDV